MNTEIQKSENVVFNPSIFDVKMKLNKTFSSIIIMTIFAIICVYILIYILSIYNLLYITYKRFYIFVISLDPLNENSLKLGETLNYKLINFVSCEGDIKEKKEITTFFEYFKSFTASVFIPECNNPYPYIYTDLKLNNIGMYLIIIIFNIIFFWSIIYVLVKLTQDNIINDEFLYMYLWEESKHYIIITVIILISLLLNPLIYKNLFIDDVMEALYDKYNKLRDIDLKFYTQGANIFTTEEPFFKLLRNSTRENIDIEYDLNENNKKIINNIKNSSSDDTKCSKIFIYSVYIYFKRQNNDNIDIVNICTRILSADPHNIITLRSLLPKLINIEEISKEFNDIVRLIGKFITDDNIFDFNYTTEYDKSDIIRTKLSLILSDFVNSINESNINVDFSSIHIKITTYVLIIFIKNIICMLLISIALLHKIFEKKFLDMMGNIPIHQIIANLLSKLLEYIKYITKRFIGL